MKKLFLGLTLLVSMFFVGLMGPKAANITLSQIETGLRSNDFVGYYNGYQGITLAVSSNESTLTVKYLYNGNGEPMTVSGTKLTETEVEVVFNYTNGILSYEKVEADSADKTALAKGLFEPILDVVTELYGYDANYVDYSNTTLENNGLLLDVSNAKFKLNVNDFKLLNNYVQKVDSATNIGLYTSANVLASDVAMTVKKLEENDKVYSEIKTKANKRLNDLVSKVVVYDVNLEKNGSKIQPNGNVTLAFPIPSGYNTVKMIVYRMEDDGSLTAVPFKVENNKIQVTTNHFSNYALVEVNYDGLVAELDCPEDEEIVPPTPENPETGNGLQYGILGLITLSCMGVYIYTKKYNKFPSMK